MVSFFICRNQGLGAFSNLSKVMKLKHEKLAYLDTGLCVNSKALALSTVPCLTVG